MISTKFIEAVVRAAASAVLCAIVPTASSGQPPAIVLQHGFFGDEHTWEQAQPNLALQIAATWIRPRTGWYLTMPEQEYNLFHYYYSGVPAASGFVGHSMGGLLGRYTLQDGRKWKGLITVGTPHRGAPVGASVVSGLVTSTINSVVHDVLYPFDFYQSYVSFLEALELQDYEEEAVQGISSLVGSVSQRVSWPL